MEHQNPTLKTGEDSGSGVNSKCDTIENVQPALCEKKILQLSLNPSLESIVISSKEKDLLASRESDHDPRNWPAKKKNLILFIIAAAGILAPISSTIFFPALIEVRNDLNTTEVLANGLVAVFILFTGIAPLGWASYSDAYATRRKVYLVSIMLFQITSVICGIANNIWVLMLMRALQACGASAVQSIGAGSISDIFHPHGEFPSISTTTSPLIGPIIGGYLTQYLGWRWIFWFLTIFGGILILIIFFALPETFRKTSPSHSLPQTSPTAPRGRFNPLAPLALLRYPNVSLTLLYVSSVFAIIYVQNTLISKNFTQLYNLRTSDVGLVFLGPSSGYIVGSVIGGKYSDFVFNKSAKKCDGGVGYPEMRLNSTWFAMISLPASYVTYGWMIAHRLGMMFPLIAMFIGGFSCLIVFNSTSTYLVDAFPGRSASAIAVNNFLRSIAAATVSAAAAPLQDALGIGWLYTIMSGLTLIGSGFLVLVYFKGKNWREKLENEGT
ncbi:4914_t:CDS:2 [Acaulospora morrowiae]|uniref:4914_t:CDS:1 n=1 Tax=Acaulospora morrowiae TaxID=94023 RepID=A0A9N8ZEI5_9GLOM|nr:4914_t:CDS:2 [Acaulospora morrowiae]